jgi:hypothetical protein
MSEERSLIQLAPDVLCQDLEDEAVFPSMKDNHYYGLDLTGTRMYEKHRERAVNCRICHHSSS